MGECLDLMLETYRIIDPHFSQEITDQITTQPDFVFTAKIRPPPGCQQNLPIQFQSMPPPPLVLSESETIQFIQKMKDQYGSKETIESAFDSLESKKVKWMTQLKAEFRTKDEWDIILFLRNNHGNLKKIVEGVQSTDRNETSKVIQTLRNDGLIIINRSKKHGIVIEHEYALSAKAKQSYFPETFESIGTANDINEISKKAYDYYLTKKFFTSLTKHDVKKNKMSCDIVAYDYYNEVAISVEIESRTEIGSHPEQVRLNMIKWKDLGFDECHMWSKSNKIDEIKNKLANESEKVQTFVV